MAVLDDSILGPIVQHSEHDSHTVGLILSGSRGAGMADDASDYDLIRVLTDSAYAERQGSGAPMQIYGDIEGRRVLDVVYSCPAQLEGLAAVPDWQTPAFLTARVLLDKTGEVTAALQAIVTMPVESVPSEVARQFDGYLNAFYRSVKAARRGNELGARMHAGESMVYLTRTLFALEGRWTPYHDRLVGALDMLQGQGWETGELRESMLAVLRTADADVQVELGLRVESLLRDRGFGSVIDAWGGEIERTSGRRWPLEG